MKKILIFLLACLMVVGLWGCEKDPQTNPEDTTDTTTAKEEVTTNPPVVIIPPVTTNETTVKLNAATENIRSLGVREDASDSVLNCNNPGSGFEIAINCDGGTVKVRTQTSDACTFRVYVDGEAWNNAEGSPYYVVNGVKNIEIPNVTAGEHTVRVVRVSDKSVATAMFYNITFEGAQVELSATSEDVPFVEFVGDGITLGAGLNGSENDAALSYAYLTANIMKADYAITAFAGQGLIAGDAPISSAYGKEGNFARRADMIVVNVGAEDFALTGDAAIDEATFVNAYKTFLKSVRAKNGATCKIICVSTSSNESLRNAVTTACEALGGATAGYYAKNLTASASALPTAEEHAAYATELATYLTSIQDDVVELTMLDNQESGYGVEVDFNAPDWNS